MRIYALHILKVSLLAWRNISKRCKMSLYWEKTATLWPDVLFQILFIRVIVFFNSLIKAKYLSLAERSARLRRSLVNAFLSFTLHITGSFFHGAVHRGEFSLEACENPWPCKHSLRESVFLWSAHQQLESEELNYRCRAACEGQPLTFHPGLFLFRAQTV